MKKEVPYNPIPRRKEAAVPPKESPRENPETRKINFFSQYARLINGDRIFGAIATSIETGWNSLPANNKEVILDSFQRLIEAMERYHASYTELKRAAKRDPSSFDSLKTYQKSIESPDKQERILHNSFIDTVNILSRVMKTLGLDNSWRADEKIYDPTPEGTREKLKKWMFEVFGEATE